MDAAAQQRKRYMTLMGDPVHTPTWQAVLINPALRAPTLVTTFMAAASYQKSLTEALAITAAGLLGAALVHPIDRFFNKRRISRTFGEAAELLCIDKFPDRKTPPTSMENRTKAASVMKTNIFGACWTATWAILFVRPAFTQVVKDLISMTPASETHSLFAASLWLSTIAYDLRNAMMFRNVTNDKWVITDLPKKVEQKQEEKLPDAVPQIG